MKVTLSNKTVNYPFTASNMSQQYLKTYFLLHNIKHTTIPSQD